MLADTHCHLDMLKNMEVALERARTAGVGLIITIGIDLESSQKAVEIAHQYDYVWAAVGIHPHEAKTVREQTYKELEALAQDPKVVAIGEIGLDFYRNLSPKEVQIRVFKRQIELAKALAKPIIIHCREAIPETWSVLEETDGFCCRGVWHCFPGDVNLAQRCMKKGFYISIPGIVTFPKAERLRRVVKETPLEWLLIETDAPFLAPVPMRGKPNEPAFLRYTAQKVAEIKECELNEVARTTTQNACKLFGINIS